MVEHVDIPEGEIHEPKGVSLANAGEVYVADGAGSGEWKGSLLNTHGEMVILNSATATAVTAAADATLNTDSDYVKITAGWTNDHLHNLSFNVDELVADHAGAYYISFWCSVKVPTFNNFVAIKYAINDTTPYSTRKIVSQSITANDYLNLAASGIIANLSAGDTVSIYIAGTITDNLIVEEAGISLLYLHE